MSARTTSQTIPLSPWPNHSLRLAVVGIGALGSEVCRLLIERGQKHVLVIDPDVVESQNIALSSLFQSAAQAHAIVGMQKGAVVAKYASREHSDATWQARNTEIADVSWSELRACDLLISCTDSALARIETAFIARSLGLPMLDAGVRSHHVPEGRVTWFSPTPTAACYLCGLSATRRAEILAYALSPSLGCTPPQHHEPMSGSPETVRTVAAALLSTLEEWKENTSSFARILRASEQENILLTMSPSCPWHDFPSPRQLVALQPEETFEAALHRLGAEVIDLPWPICLSALCSNCELQSEPMQRTAYVRRRAICPHCTATGTLEPLACIESIGLGDPAGKWTARQLGLPPAHLYRLRSIIRLETSGLPLPRSADPSSGRSAEVL